MKIYIDYDCTLVNFVDIWVDLINEKTEDSITLEEIDQFFHPILDKHNWLFLEYDIYSHVTPFPGAIEFVNALRESHDVVILTHTYSESGIIAKQAHIQKYFGDVSVIQTDKPKHLWSKDGILIDDGIHNIIGHVGASDHVGILFNFQNQYRYVNKTCDNPQLVYHTDYASILQMI